MAASSAGAAQAVEGAEEAQVLAGGQLLEQREVLGDEADGALGGIGVAGERRRR